MLCRWGLSGTHGPPRGDAPPKFFALYRASPEMAPGRRARLQTWLHPRPVWYQKTAKTHLSNALNNAAFADDLLSGHNS